MQQSDHWLRQLWPAVIFIAVAWIGAFVISFIVAESQSSNGGDESVFRIKQGVEWVSCQASKTQGIASGMPLTPGERIRVRNECSIASEAWILCVDEEFSKLSEQELAAFESSDAVEFSDTCRERVGVPPAATDEDS